MIDTNVNLSKHEHSLILVKRITDTNRSKHDDSIEQGISRCIGRHEQQVFEGCHCCKNKLSIYLRRHLSNSARIYGRSISKWTPKAKCLGNRRFMGISLYAMQLSLPRLRIAMHKSSSELGVSFIGGSSINKFYQRPAAAKLSAKHDGTRQSGQRSEPDLSTDRLSDYTWV